MQNFSPRAGPIDPLRGLLLRTGRVEVPRAVASRNQKPLCSGVIPQRALVISRLRLGVVGYVLLDELLLVSGDFVHDEN